MKPLFSAVIIIMMFYVLINSSCNKNTASPTINNTIDTCQYDTANYTFKDSITLWNKPADTIRKYIQGSWNLLYYYGGLAGLPSTYTNKVWRFTKFNNRIEIAPNASPVVSAFQMEWCRIWSPDSSFIIKHNSGINLVALYKHKDTLILADDAYDGFYYHLVKQ